MSFSAKRLRDVRLQLGRTQRDVRAVAQTTLSAIESGRQRPHPSTLRKLAEEYGVEVRAFFEEVEEAPKVLRPHSLDELLHRIGVPSRWLTLDSEEFKGWWLDVDRKEAARRYQEIRAEYQAIAAEWSAIQEGKSTVAPELQNEIRRRMHEFFARHFGARAAAPGQEETEAEFYERQRQGAYRQTKQVDMEALEKELKKIVPRAG